MSLKTIVRFCAVHPFYVIGFWIFLMVAAGFLSQLYLDDALKGGQGPTRDLEFALAQKMILTQELLQSHRAHTGRQWSNTVKVGCFGFFKQGSHNHH